jgi:hypothetical protein
MLLNEQHRRNATTLSQFVMPGVVLRAVMVKKA